MYTYCYHHFDWRTCIERTNYYFKMHTVIIIRFIHRRFTQLICTFSKY